MAHRLKATRIATLLTAVGLGALAPATTTGAQSTSAPYEFKGGFPTPETVTRAYDDADLNRAVQAYRFFYPNVSVAGMFAGFEQDFGLKYNTTYGILEGLPRHLLYTPNSDTPYAVRSISASGRLLSNCRRGRCSAWQTTSTFAG